MTHNINRDIFNKYEWDDELSKIKELLTKNCIGCVTCVKGVCQRLGIVPEHRCFEYKKEIK